MVRAVPEALEHGQRAIEVARRVGDPLPEVNARINLFSFRPGRPDADEIREVIELAWSIGAYDEAYRAAVNYLWNSQPFDPLDDVEAVVDAIERRLAPVAPPETYASYLALSRARLILLPSGRWDEVHPVLTQHSATEFGGSRLLWLDIVSSFALRLGDLATADVYLPTLRDTALASNEPQRIFPMAFLCVPRAAIDGDRRTVDDLSALVERLLDRMVPSWVGKLPTTPIIRAHWALRADDLLHRHMETLRRTVPAEHSAVVRATIATGEGLLALAEGRAGAAVDALTDATEVLDSRGRAFEAACARLELAEAREASGDAAGAAATLEQARAVLDPLRCVHAF